MLVKGAVLHVWSHHDVIKWKHFPRYWLFVRGIHLSPVNSRHKRQWRGAFMFSLICTRINRWVNNSKAGDLRRHRAHYDVIVMIMTSSVITIDDSGGARVLCFMPHLKLMCFHFQDEDSNVYFKRKLALRVEYRYTDSADGKLITFPTK